MIRMAPDVNNYVWPDCTYAAVDKSLCYHSRQHLKSLDQFDDKLYDRIPYVVNTVERVYATTKVEWSGWPSDFSKFIRKSVDWNSSPGWPWKRQYPTNKELFGFDGVNIDPIKTEMVRCAVYNRWQQLIEKPVADPIHVFIKQEPHKKTKRDKEAWRLISGVGLTDTLIDRILYGQWLDDLILRWNEIPSKAGWAPQLNGFKFLTRHFRNRTPVSIDKSSWDWTVNRWHISILNALIPRMIFGITSEWSAVFKNRFVALFGADYPIFKYGCGCEFLQRVDGIMKSGCFGTIGFNSILQFADHVAVGGDEQDVFEALGDDTAQESFPGIEQYIENLKKTGAIIKEIDVGWPIKFGGHEMTEETSVPSYRGKHMFQLLHLDEKFGPETLESYRHLYALDSEMSEFLEKLALRLYGPRNLLSRANLRDWYLAIDQY